MPDYAEDMAYNMPSYSANKKGEVAFASQKQHFCAFILIHSVMLDHADRQEGICHGKGCLRFGNADKIDVTFIADLLDTTCVSEE